MRRWLILAIHFSYDLLALMFDIVNFLAAPQASKTTTNNNYEVLEEHRPNALLSKLQKLLGTARTEYFSKIISQLCEYLL